MSLRPLVHMNGSSADYLLSTLSEAQESLLVTLRAMNAAAPNARDYYPLGDGESAFKAARDLHDRFMRELRAMRAEIVCAMEHVQEQIDEREAHHGR